MAKLLRWSEEAMWGWVSRSARAGSRRPWRSGGRRKKEEKARDGGALGGSYRPRSSWAKEVVSGGSRFGPGRLDGERVEEAAALRRPGVSWRLGKGPGTRVRARRCQGAGQVALRDSPGSIWPWARGGRSPPAAYGGRRAKQSQPGERDGDGGSFAISEISRDLSVN